jgi:peptidoglycan/xylan/chitin deacetylase (PgdA/CDA1 family)
MKQGNKNVILNYHGVIAGNFRRINNRHMPAAQFEEDLQFLKKRFNVVSLAEIFSNPEPAASQSKPKVAITFDDGFENNVEFAVPLLKKYNLPATIFILSASIENPAFVNWTDLLDVLAAGGSYPKLEFMGEIFVLRPGGYVSDAATPVSLSDFIKNKGEDRLKPLEDLQKLVTGDKSLMDKFRYHIQLMNPDQLRACVKTGLIEIASHSRYHFNMGRIPLSLAIAELEHSKKTIENVTQQEVKSFAYPDGDYSTPVKDEAEKAGYSHQLAVSLQLPEDPADKRIRKRFSYSNSTTHQSNFVRLGMQWSQFAF